MNGDVAAVRSELLAELTAGDFIDDPVDGKTLAGRDPVFHLGHAPAVFDFPGHLGPIVAYRLQVLGDIGAGALDLRWIENDRRRTDGFPEFVDAHPAAVRPVVDAHARSPAEDESLFGLLPDVWSHLRGRKLLPLEDHFVGQQAVVSFGDQFRGAARDKSQ